MFGLLCLVTFNGNIDCANLGVFLWGRQRLLCQILPFPIAANKIVDMFIGLINLKLWNVFNTSNRMVKLLGDNSYLFLVHNFKNGTKLVIVMRVHYVRSLLSMGKEKHTFSSKTTSFCGSFENESHTWFALGGYTLVLERPKYTYIIYLLLPVIS